MSLACLNDNHSDNHRPALSALFVLLPAAATAVGVGIRTWLGERRDCLNAVRQFYSSCSDRPGAFS